VASARIVEAIDVFEDGDFGIAARLPALLPQQLCLDRLEERRDRRVIIAVAFTAYRHLEAMLAQDFLVFMRAVLAAPVGMMNASFQRPAQGDGHVQRPDRQIALHPIAYCPADDAPRMQVQNDSQVELAFPGPHITDVPSPFLVRAVSNKVPIQQVRWDVEAVITVSQVQSDSACVSSERSAKNDPARRASIDSCHCQSTWRASYDRPSQLLQIDLARSSPSGFG
jgi:hypothetical protein